MVTLEKKGRRNCPKCGRKSFALYIGDEGGYIAENVGYCSHKISCKYNYPPRQYNADNRRGKTQGTKDSNSPVCFSSNGLGMPPNHLESAPTDYIPVDLFLPTLDNYERNAFFLFLKGLFPGDFGVVTKVVKSYFVGTQPNYYGSYTCFPYIDTRLRIERGKLIRFGSENGKRLKGDFDTHSLSSLLKIKKDFKYGNCFFGEHLLLDEVDKPVAVVESEKSAIIARICIPDHLWLACGSLGSLNSERLKRLEGREIILYPDGNGFDQWSEVALKANRAGLSVSISTQIEKFGSETEKKQGDDLVDYFIEQQILVNKHNKYVDQYNKCLNRILGEQTLFESFTECYNERLFQTGLNELALDEIRSIVLNVAKDSK